jgi:hypothetical protein
MKSEALAVLQIDGGSIWCFRMCSSPGSKGGFALAPASGQTVMA